MSNNSRKGETQNDDTAEPFTSSSTHRKSRYGSRSRSRSCDSLKSSRTSNSLKSSRSHRRRDDRNRKHITSRSSGERKEVKPRPLSAEPLRYGSRSRSCDSLKSSRSSNSLKSSRSHRRRDDRNREHIASRSSGERREVKPRPVSANDIQLSKDENVRPLTSDQNHKNSSWKASDLQKKRKDDGGNQPVDERALVSLSRAASSDQPNSESPSITSGSPGAKIKKRGRGSRSPQSNRHRKRGDKSKSIKTGNISSPTSRATTTILPVGDQENSESRSMTSGSPGAKIKKRGQGSRSPQSNRHRKRGDKSKSSKSSPTSRATTTTLPIGDATEKTFTAETVNEHSDAYNRKRIRDLEVANDQMQQQMQDALKSNRGENGEAQDTASNGGRRITICKALAIVAVYLAGVGTGFLLSELRRRKASLSPKEIYITQSPTALVAPTAAPTEFSYDEPTKEECFVIENKEEVEGQDGMITRSYDVHFDVQLKDVSTDWYRQLEEGVTDNVIPDLACCKTPTEQRRLVMDSPPMNLSIRGRSRMLRNIRCVVANGSTRGEYNDNGESCVELTGLCLPAVVTFDLTLKGDESDGDMIDLVRSVIDDVDDSETLVEKFDLDRNVFSVVKLVEVTDHIPTEAPAISAPTTSRPTLSPTVSLSPVVGPTTNSPTRVVTQSPTTRGATPKPTFAETKSPTFAPAPGVTPRPTPGPTPGPTPEPLPQPSLGPTPSPTSQTPGSTPLPTAEPSRGPTESPSSFPSFSPTLRPSSTPTVSPTTPEPSLTPSTAPTGRRDVLEAILTPLVGTIDASALDWLADTDTWSPDPTEADPDSMWLERYAMVQLYLACNGDAWTDKGAWMTSTSVCDWTPSACNGDSRMEVINLNANGLTGTIPTEIGLLTALTYLDIEDNDLTGSIPSEFGSLSNLRMCLLKDNGLSGTIGSELGAMTELLELDIQRNPLTGSLPSEFGSLTRLTLIAANDSSFTGSIPSELGRATMLERLRFKNTGISGSIPTTLGQLTRMRIIDFVQTNLSGPLPSELGRLTALESFDMKQADCSGTIPSQMNLLTSLEHFTIDNTQISGSIPDLSALVNLDTLGFSNCKLTGSIPPGMFNNMSKLQVVRFSKNSLTGTIPAIPNPALLTTCAYNGNCFSDVTNAGTCNSINNCL